ncbi:MAG: hypothetical protein IPM57_06560 [Oligoflexia bacterium]|nr:hypothetical protein [Oligoflexia bacterium]
MNNSIDASDANYIYPRNMLASALFLEFGYQINDFTPYIYGEYRYMGQLTPARSVANQNMAGSGYALGAGLKYKVEDFFISGSYTFLGSYTLAKPTCRGQKHLFKCIGLYIYYWLLYWGKHRSDTFI